MDARQLAYFLAVVEHLNFGRAAEQLHIAQPSLSQAIGTLEREVGVPLFHRVGRGIVLSDAGAQLIEPARQVLRDLESAKAAVQSTQGLQRGRVELVSMPSPGIEPLTTMVRDFGVAHRAMSVSVTGVFAPDEVIHAVKSGQGEIGLLGSATSPNTAGLLVLPVEDQPLVLVSPREPALGAQTEPAERVSRSELAGLRLIVSKEGSLMRQLVDDVLASGVEAEIVVEVEHRTSILPMVLAGIGHAVVPSSWTPLAERAGALVREVEPASYLRIALVTRKAVLTPSAKAFMRIAKAYVAHHKATAPSS
jgi:DNA-binding transcriptional LysR family regulator